MNAVALTDHGRCGELLSFKKACDEVNVKPIFGCEVYCAPESRFLKEKLDNHTKIAYHMVILAKNDIGLQNVFKLCSIGWTEGKYYKPRVDMEALREYSEGLVVLSGCGSGRASVMFMEDRDEEAIEWLAECKEIWGEDFYVEVQNHGLEWQRPLYQKLCAAAKQLNIKTVVTQDSHYPEQKDSNLHNYICKLSAGDLSFDSDQSWFKTYDEILDMTLGPEWTDSVHETQLVADKCNVEWNYGETIWPVFDLPEGITPEVELERKTREGLAALPQKDNQEYKDRIEYELGIINQMGFATYFLVVADFIQWAKNNGIPVGAGRGSAAGSLVCFCLNITRVDPIKYELYFERFLNPSRISLPDIDVDFCPEGRKEVFKYVFDKYGAEKCAQIGTTSAFKPRGALRAFARVSGHEPFVGDQLAKLVPPDVAGKPLTFDEVVKAEPKLLNTDYPEVVNLARKAEGIKNQAGVHAAGLLISNTDLSKQVPLFLGKNDEVATQFDMHDVEEIGLVKYDFLGLKNLTVINNTVKMIKQNYGIDIDPDQIEDHDELTYDKIFRHGDLEGIFQFETSSGFKDLCMQVSPKSIEDLSTITALFRPGPLGTKDEEGKSMVNHYVEGRNGKNIKCLFPELELILKSTYGVMTYQEQIMKICSHVAGYTLAEADNMRKIIGKKLPEKMKSERKKFVSGCVNNKIDEDKANTLFDNIEGFAKYSFNKAHSVAYSMISYQTAWLKAHYPKEFYTALLNNSINKSTDKLVKYIYATRDKGIPIVSPDINRSSSMFTLNEGTILFGLSGIKGVGDKACEQLINNRPETGFKTLEEVVKAKVKKDVIAALGECGALEEISELSRVQIVEHLTDLIEYYKKHDRWKLNVEKFETNKVERMKAIEAGEKPPRRKPQPKEEPTLKELEPSEPISRADRLALERKTLGFYITGHPLDDYPGLSRMAKYTISDLKEGLAADKETVILPVVISSLKPKRTRNKKNMATMIMEDKTGRIEAVIFPRQWQKLQGILEEGTVNTVVANVEKIEPENNDDGIVIVKLIVNNVSVIDSDTINLQPLVIQLTDGSSVKFIPEQECNVSAWQQATAYVTNLKRMGYK